VRFLIVMDPPARINPRSDTTFVIMEEAQARGHELLHCEPAQLALEGTRAVATVRPARVERAAGAPVELGQPRTVALADCDAVLMRKDPPYDLDYHLATLLLERARGQSFLMNDPRGLREANEKLYACNFPQLMPRTLVAADKQRIRSFVQQVGGRGVFHLRAGDRNVPSILETLTDDGRRWVMGQKYLPAARAGDKRILLLDGAPIGAVLRVPREDEVRGNLHVGGRPERTTLDTRDREICAAMSARLRADGLWFVGIDVIGGFLTEVNVTSPTGVQEVNALEGMRLQA